MRYRENFEMILGIQDFIIFHNFGWNSGFTVQTGIDTYFIDNFECTGIKTGQIPSISIIF
jgi:hypothetical protein